MKKRRENGNHECDLGRRNREWEKGTPISSRGKKGSGEECGISLCAQVTKLFSPGPFSITVSAKREGVRKGKSFLPFLRRAIVSDPGLAGGVVREIEGSYRKTGNGALLVGGNEDLGEERKDLPSQALAGELNLMGGKGGPLPERAEGIFLAEKKEK